MSRRFSSPALIGGSILQITLRACMGLTSGYLIGEALFGSHGIIFGNKTVASKSHAAPMNNAIRNNACGCHNKALQTCFEKTGGDISKCQFYLDMLSQCHHGPGASTFAGVKGALLN